MARISRKAGVMITAPQSTIYRAAVYARLSVEDNGLDKDSIDFQIALLKSYISMHPDLTLSEVFVDNGRTGTNFSRPGFEAMMDQIKDHKINCVVVKDLSRFGRNFIETGNYIENIFPYLGIRFISVNDGYDSSLTNWNQELTVSIKNLVHDLYAKDISRKICSVLDIKKKKGEFLGKFAPYGYLKSETNCHLLEVNEETAYVVRLIFQWRSGGLGPAAIARKLNQHEVPSPNRYLLMKGYLKGRHGENDSTWHGSTVSAILSHPVYTGCLIERKTESAYYKNSRKVTLEKTEWNLIQNTHPPIIDKEIFEQVQLLTKPKNPNPGRGSVPESPDHKSPFSGLVQCGFCNRRMRLGGSYYNKKKSKTTHRFYCDQRYHESNSCRVKSILEDELTDAVDTLLETLVMLFGEKARINWPLAALVKNIIIYDNRRIEIVLCSRDEFDVLP